MSAIWLAGHGLTQGEQSIDFPRPDRLVQGNPQRQTYSLYETHTWAAGFGTVRLVHGIFNLPTINKNSFK